MTYQAQNGQAFAALPFSSPIGFLLSTIPCSLAFFQISNILNLSSFGGYHVFLST